MLFAPQPPHQKHLDNSPQCDNRSRAVKPAVITAVATVLMVGCGAQPTQESAKPVESAAKTPVPPPEAVTLAPVQPGPEVIPSKPTAQAPAQPAPEVKPVEPVVPKNKPAEWETATRGNWDVATRGNTELIKQLLADGMDVDVTDKEGLTALYRAAHNDQKETVSLLLRNGVNVNIRDKFGNTPLDVTLNDNIANILRKHGGKTGQELKAEGN